MTLFLGFSESLKILYLRGRHVGIRYHLGHRSHLKESWRNKMKVEPFPARPHLPTPFTYPIEQSWHFYEKSENPKHNNYPPEAEIFGNYPSFCSRKRSFSSTELSQVTKKFLAPAGTRSKVESWSKSFKTWKLKVFDESWHFFLQTPPLHLPSHYKSSCINHPFHSHFWTSGETYAWTKIIWPPDPAVKSKL